MKEVAQRVAQIGIGRQQEVIDPAGSTAMRDVVDEVPHRQLIRLAKRPWFRLKLVRFSIRVEPAFDVAKQNRIIERQLNLVAIEDLKNEDFVPLMLKSPESQI